MRNSIKGFVRRNWLIVIIVVAVVAWATIVNRHNDIGPGGIAFLGFAMLLLRWHIDTLEQENHRLKNRNDWVMRRANSALEFAANAEVALQAMAERHHEAEMTIAGVSIPKSIWIDGVRIPVDDADEDDLEVGQPLIQPHEEQHPYQPGAHRARYDWKDEMP